MTNKYLFLSTPTPRRCNCLNVWYAYNNNVNVTSPPEFNFHRRRTFRFRLIRGSVINGKINADDRLVHNYYVSLMCKMCNVLVYVHCTVGNSVEFSWYMIWYITVCYTIYNIKYNYSKTTGPILMKTSYCSQRYYKSLNRIRKYMLFWPKAHRLSRSN